MIASLLASLLLAVAPASARTDDVQLAAQHLRDDHPNLFHDLSPAQFDTAVANLSAHADSLDDDQLLVGLMRLGAMPGVRDGHTGIFPLNPANRRLLHAYPIRMYTFTDASVAPPSGWENWSLPDPSVPPHFVWKTPLELNVWTRWLLESAT